MAQITDVLICGSGFRGLWLASELNKLGWKVTWIPLQPPRESKIKGSTFIFDDWAWQVGPVFEKSKLVSVSQDFIKKVFCPKEQNMSVQIITPQGPIELSNEGLSGWTPTLLKNVMGGSVQNLNDFLGMVFSSTEIDHLQGQKLLMSHSKKMTSVPFAERWPLEWLAGLRRSRDISTFDWVLKHEGELLNPSQGFWLLDSSFKEVYERALTWAQEQGVQIKRNSKVVDIGFEGKTATGVEIQGEGFWQSRNVVLACSRQLIQSRFPQTGKIMKVQTDHDTEKYIWARCGFLMKHSTKPEGLQEFSSYVIDPYMPYKEANMGVLKWKLHDQHESLTVWVKIPFGEQRRRSYLMELNSSIQRNLELLFPRFSKNLQAVIPFEDYFETAAHVHDDYGVVYDSSWEFAKLKTPFKNIWFAGPECDRGLELLSQIATEYRILQQLALVREKELKRDRKIQPPRNGKSLVTEKSI